MGSAQFCLAALLFVSLSAPKDALHLESEISSELSGDRDEYSHLSSNPCSNRPRLHSQESYWSVKTRCPLRGVLLPEEKGRGLFRLLQHGPFRLSVGKLTEIYPPRSGGAHPSLPFLPLEEEEDGEDVERRIVEMRGGSSVGDGDRRQTPSHSPSPAPYSSPREVEVKELGLKKDNKGGEGKSEKKGKKDERGRKNVGASEKDSSAKGEKKKVPASYDSEVLLEQYSTDWWRDRLMILLVFSLTGTTVVRIVRPFLNKVVGLQGSLWAGPWKFRLIYVCCTMPTYSCVLILIGTIFGRHLYFRNFAARMWSRILFPLIYCIRAMTQR